MSITIHVAADAVVFGLGHTLLWPVATLAPVLLQHPYTLAVLRAQVTPLVEHGKRALDVQKLVALPAITEPAAKAVKGVSQDDPAADLKAVVAAEPAIEFAKGGGDTALEDRVGVRRK